MDCTVVHVGLLALLGTRPVTMAVRMRGSWWRCRIVRLIGLGVALWWDEGGGGGEPSAGGGGGDASDMFNDY